MNNHDNNDGSNKNIRRGKKRKFHKNDKQGRSLGLKKKLQKMEQLEAERLRNEVERLRNDLKQKDLNLEQKDSELSFIKTKLAETQHKIGDMELSSSILRCEKLILKGRLMTLGDDTVIPPEEIKAKMEELSLVKRSDLNLKLVN